MTQTIVSTSGTYNGTAGDDDLLISVNLVHVFGGDGNDTLTAGTGIFLDLNGGNGNDRINLSEDDDMANGNMGSDTINGEEGNDTLQGGQDNDEVYGGYDDDNVNGNRGADTVYGNEGNDIVHGGRGADYVAGNAGNDTLFGDLGGDQINGGTGADIFVFGTTPQADPAVTTEIDFVQDFSRAEGDKIGLTGGLTFHDISLTATGQTRIDYDANGTHHTIFLQGVNINLVESDFVTI